MDISFRQEPLRLTPFNRPHIVYNSAQKKGLSYAYRTDSGWVHVLADTPIGDTIGDAAGSLVIDKNGISHWIDKALFRVDSNYAEVLRYGYGKPYESLVEDTIMPPYYIFSIYPNPFSREAFLKWPLGLKGDVDIEVYDVLGRMLLRERMMRKMALKLKVPSGSYFLVIKKNGRTLYKQKILKEK